MVARREIPARSAPEAPPTRLPSRPNRGVMVCPSCGEAIVGATCVCGFAPIDPQRLGLDRIHAYCAMASAIVFVRKGQDHYLIDHERVRFRASGDRLMPVEAALVFPAVHGIPCLWEYELTALQTPDLKVMVYPRPGKPGEPRALAFPAFVEVLSRELGLEAAGRLEPFDMPRVFELRHAMPPGEIARVSDEALRWGLSFGHALIKSLDATPDHLLKELFGPDCYFRPTHRMANALGFELLFEGMLEPAQLADLLGRQVEYPKPLAQLVLSTTSLTEADLAPLVDAIRQRQVMRPVRDRLGERLVARGALSRQLLDIALEQLKVSGGSIEPLLAGLGVSPQALREERHRQRIKDQLRMGGQVRLGEILVKRGVISRQQLLEALVDQIDQQIPLGEILIRRGMASHEQVYLGLAQQEATLDAFVTIEQDMERQDQAPGGNTLTFTLDLDKEKERINSLLGGLKQGFKAGFQELKSAFQAVRESEPEDEP